MMVLLHLKKEILYGPVHSRRLGLSLGINVTPGGKACSFDCAYCHYGRTHSPQRSPPMDLFAGVEEVRAAVSEALRSDTEFHYLTFSGNGEATLHPAFPQLIRAVRDLRDRIRPGVRLATLSNSTTVHRPEIRDALALLDEPIMKMDAGERRTFIRINRPAPGVDFETVLSGLEAMENPIIQSLLVNGTVSNARGKAHAAWLDALDRIRPREVQIYSIDRPFPEFGLMKVSPTELAEIAEVAEGRLNVPVRAYWPKG